MVVFFFFQAEDGIRDADVTGVQTCALPICADDAVRAQCTRQRSNRSSEQRAAASADTASRKLQEIRYAVALEQRLSKEDVLDRRLNIAYFGAGAYGIDAASGSSRRTRTTRSAETAPAPWPAAGTSLTRWPGWEPSPARRRRPRAPNRWCCTRSASRTTARPWRVGTTAGASSVTICGNGGIPSRSSARPSRTGTRRWPP